MSDIQRILDHLRCARSSDECQCLDCLAADEINRLLEIKKTLSLQAAGLLTENERLKAFIADKIHDATRERMLMEVKGE